jgi:hydrogenase maturation protease
VYFVLGAPGAAAVKPRLVIGLGNSLMGDDGIGSRIAAELQRDPSLPPEVEVIDGGTDLLRMVEQVAGREHVFVVDAIAGGEPGTLTVYDNLDTLDYGQEHVHHLSVPQAVALLGAATGVPVTLVLVSIVEARAAERLSELLAARLVELTGKVRKMVSLPAAAH